jgi:ATP-binding cassette subfamily C protein CydD
VPRSSPGGIIASGRTPLERRLLAVREVRRAVVASVALGLVSATSVAVQALALASLLAGAMSATLPDPLPAVAWLAGSVLIRGLCHLAAELVGARGSAAAKAALRRSLLDAALRSGGGGSAGAPGSVATLAGRGLDALDPYIGRCLPDLILAAAVPIGLAAVIGGLDWLSGIIVVVVIGLFPVFAPLVGRAGASLARERWGQIEAFGRQIADVFEGLPVLKAYGRSARQRGRIQEAGEVLRVASLSTLRVALLTALVLDTLASVAVALLAVPLGLRLLTGSVPLSTALAVLVVAPEVFLPLRRASAEFHESAEGLAAARRIMDVVAASATEGGAPPRRRTPGRPPLDPARASVTLEAVRFQHPDGDRPLLEGASLSILPGEKVALVGANGAGKSTTILLLLGFLAPAAGAVRVGGIDLQDLDLEAWRKRLAYLPEHPALLNASLADNVGLSDPTASMAQLGEAMRRAGAGDLLARLPDGLETRLGEGGRALSAGERQRIAVARALLRPASLYLLDEPTTHLDAALERLLVESLAERLRGRSALIVTHRPALLRLADRVVALEGGTFVPAAAPAAARRATPRALAVPA